MKTIEQHLQDLLIGRYVRISCKIGRNTSIQDGVCQSINQIHTTENGKDIWAITLSGNKTIELYADCNTDTIAIIEQ